MRFITYEGSKNGPFQGYPVFSKYYLIKCRSSPAKTENDLLGFPLSRIGRNEWPHLISVGLQSAELMPNRNLFPKGWRENGFPHWSKRPFATLYIVGRIDFEFNAQVEVWESHLWKIEFVELWNDWWLHKINGRTDA